MKYRRMKAAAMVVIFLIAGVLYSADRGQDIFLYEKAHTTESESILAQKIGEDSPEGAVSSETKGDFRKPEETLSQETQPKIQQSAAQQEGFLQSEEALQPEEAGKLHVHVCGAVKKAGVYLLPEDSIVKDAVEAAGGIVKGGAADYLNLAGIVSEGDKIYVPYLKDVENPCGEIPQPEQSKTGFGQSSTSSELVNINTADENELTTLPGIGGTRAEAIISYREMSGGFRSIEEIMKVSGIKKGAFEKIKDRITV